jgi:SAM-dependent methyltransferase
LVEQDLTLFDESASSFAAWVDRLIAMRRYRRGECFIHAAQSVVPAEGYILDYGCGPGRISALLAGRGFRVLGVDPSAAMIEAARQQPRGSLSMRFETASTPPLGNEHCGFDAIVCSSVIEYEVNPDELLQRFYAALRPTGTLIISFANSQSVWRRLFQKRNMMLGAQRHTWTWSAFRDLLLRNGFESNREAVYYETAFDRFPLLRFLAGSRFVGPLGLAVATKDASFHGAISAPPTVQN